MAVARVLNSIYAETCIRYITRVCVSHARVINTSPEHVGGVDQARHVTWDSCRNDNKSCVVRACKMPNRSCIFHVVLPWHSVRMLAISECRVLITLTI